jgi:hypothetical protein
LEEKKLPKDRIRTKARTSWDEKSKNKRELVPRKATIIVSWNYGPESPESPGKLEPL